MNKSSIEMFLIAFHQGTHVPNCAAESIGAKAPRALSHWPASTNTYLFLSRQNHYSYCLMPQSITELYRHSSSIALHPLNSSSVRLPLTTITHILNMY